MKKAIIIGSGAGGAALARDLADKFEVTILETGGAFKPFSYPLTLPEAVKKTGLLFDEREIQLLFPAMRIRKTADKMTLVNGRGIGGTTTLSAGNALRMDGPLKKIGINLDAEFAELYRDIPVSTAHQKRWKQSTKQLYTICEEMGLHPQPTTKMGDYEKCVHCGRCVLGCPQGVKWDSRKFLDNAVSHGAKLITGCRVTQIIIENGRAVGVQAKQGSSTVTYNADLVLVAAGGFGTPAILNNSGFNCENRLFVDPVLCVAAAWPNALQNKEISMPFLVQQEHYILSPYFDYLSYFFNRHWNIPARDIVSMMIKLADTPTGHVEGDKIRKALTDTDKERLQQGVQTCTEILLRLGVDKEKIFLGTINAGHPGGMLPLTINSAATFHPDILPENVYVADASLFPESLGNPPIFTIMAMAKRVGKLVVEKFTG
ncbi:MAG TPA: GMC family oxidoreductase N-terminal domain-containing protein [bacterium]|nr:GMC family oxidoreductase N-terminal domain-containing protein [bacterium]HPN42233.1 GMC family oxidoreductase N-terminal domain-containing protein [bacterium]